MRPWPAHNPRQAEHFHRAQAARLLEGPTAVGETCPVRESMGISSLF